MRLTHINLNFIWIRVFKLLLSIYIFSIIYVQSIFVLITSIYKITYEGIVPHQSKRILGKKPGEDDSISIRFFNKVAIESFMKKHKGTTPTFWGSKAMIQSVDEVCNDIIWGEKRELGNIGLMLQNYICRELIEEVVIELGFCKMHPLPFESCKRRLSF